MLGKIAGKNVMKIWRKYICSTGVFEKSGKCNLQAYCNLNMDSTAEVLLRFYQSFYVSTFLRTHLEG